MRCHIWRNSVDFVDIRSRYLYWRLAFIVKSGFNYNDTTWAPWRFRTKTTPNKRAKICITNPLWVISGFPWKGAINAENVSMLCGWKCLKPGTHIKYHVWKPLLNSLEARLFVQQLIQVNKKEDSYYCPFVKTIHRYPMDLHAITPIMRENISTGWRHHVWKCWQHLD